MNTRSPSFASDELLERLDGLLVDLRALRAEVHELSAGADGDAARTDAKERKKKRKKKSKNKHKKKANARND